MSGAVKVRVWLALPVTVHPWWSILWCLRQNRGAVGSGGDPTVGPVGDVVYFGVVGGGVAAGLAAALVALLDGGA